MKEKQLASNKHQLKINPKRYGGTKSQEHLSWDRKEDNFLQFRSNNKFGLQQKQNKKKYLLLIIKKGSEEFQQVKIPYNTSMSAVKVTLCNKLLMENGTVYFTSIDKDYNFDYRLHEQIGTLTSDKRLELRLISKVDLDKKQQSKLSSYFIYDCLSVGGFSKVFPLRSKKSGNFYAAKFVDKCDEDPDKFRELIYNQKYINQLLDYPMLVKMHQFIETKDFYIFVLDYCPSGELFCLMKQNRDMTEEQAKFFFIETILGIDYMHKKSIIYRDIKPENILLDKNGHIKIADFGLAKIMREKSTSYCGSLEYMAPEIVLGSEHSFGVDHYCLGSLLYEMMVGCPPFYNPAFNPNQTKYHIVNSDVKFPSRRGYSDNLIDFITKLLDKNPKTRLGSMGGIKQILSHPWVGKFDRKLFENHEIDPPIRRPLDQNNFETSSLPKQAILQTMIKIEAELNLEKGQSKMLKEKKPRNIHGIERQKLKTNEMVEERQSIVKRSRSQKEQQNFEKRKKITIEGNTVLQNSKSISKNPSRSLHISPLEKTKKSLSKLRQYSKSIKVDHNVRFSCSSLNFLKNLLGNQNKVQKRKMRKSMENYDALEKGNQMRKSQNFDKQNQFKNLKFKFELKSKQMKKNEEGKERSTFAQRKTKQRPKEEQKCKINRALNKAIYNSLMK